MTLGSNVTNVWNIFNEPKKRKLEVMNGLAEDSSHPKPNHSTRNSHQRPDSPGDEIPAKRSRFDSSSQMSNNNKSKTWMEKLTEKPKNIFKSGWNRLVGTSRPPEATSTSTNLNSCDTLPTPSVSGLAQQSVDPESIAVPPQPVINQHVIHDNQVPTASSSVPNEGKKKKRFNFKNLLDRKRYQDLINRYRTPTASHSTIVKPLSATKPIETIDLAKDETTDEPEKEVIRPMTPKTVQFKTQVLDKNSNSSLDLVTRIRNNGISGVSDLQLVTSSKSSAKELWTERPKHHPFTTQSWSQTPSISFTKHAASPVFEKKGRSPLIHSTPKPAIPATPPRSPVHSCPSSPLPQSSVKFREHSEQQNKYFDSSFVSEMRSKFDQMLTNHDFKITKSEQIAIEAKNKRESDCQRLSPKIRSPVTESDKRPLGSYYFYQPFEEPCSEEESEEEEEEVPYLPPLTDEMNKQINAALRPTPPDEVLSEGPTGQICRKDMETLNGLNWLNDEIINFYLSLIVERGKNDNFSTVYAFNTFFYKKLKDSGPQSLKRWTRRVDVFANDFIFIPIHLGMHWCLAVINFVNKKIVYYDSMGGKNNDCVESLKAWLQSESLDKKKVEFPMTEWELEMAQDIPHQMNGSDCGMFTCKYAEYISRKAKINFHQSQMPYFRRRMVYEILTKQLL